jgi:muramoyltetrapeptide carboxypeptidase
MTKWKTTIIPGKKDALQIIDDVTHYKISNYNFPAGHMADNRALILKTNFYSFCSDESSFWVDILEY